MSVLDSISEELFICHVFVRILKVKQAVGKDSLLLQARIDSSFLPLAFVQLPLAISGTTLSESAARAQKLIFDAKWLVIANFATISHTEPLQGLLIRL